MTYKAARTAGPSVLHTLPHLIVPALLIFLVWRSYKGLKATGAARAAARAEAAAAGGAAGARADVGGVHIHLHVGNSVGADDDHGVIHYDDDAAVQRSALELVERMGLVSDPARRGADANGGVGRLLPGPRPVGVPSVGRYVAIDEEREG